MSDQRWIARTVVERAWEQHARQGSAEGVRDEVLASWQRSQVVERERHEAPLADEDRVAERWRGSPLRRAVDQMEDDLERVVGDGDFIAALTNADGTILWTRGSRWMRDRAEEVHFAPAGRWDEASIGTNALALALRDRAPVEVFSAEHHCKVLHDWVCYSAPVVDTGSGRLLGVLDLSTTWDRAHPLGLSTATLLARNLSLLVPPGSVEPDQPGITLRTLGRSTASVDGRPLSLPPRQLEILAVLALHPDGLSLEALHAALFPDLRVQPATVKAEVSHLRRQLGDGVIGSRPYRLLVPVRADHVEVLDQLRAGRVGAAVESFSGPLLPDSEAPALREHGYYLEQALRRAVLALGDPDLLFALGARLPWEVELHERAVATLPEGDPRRAIAQARTDTARR